MRIQHNRSAAEASRRIEIQSTNFQKSAERLGSGYKINRAADGAAQLSISEKMRAQIRGLNKSIQNAEEGANYIQVADGAMEEIHGLLHRMNELAVQSLNDTNTKEDRAAMAAEFDQLQCEIDRIGHGTDYNSQPVFEQHAPSFYQVQGNRYWTANQTHVITAPGNDLMVRLPDSYAPNPTQYTLTVPSGVYTTQELIDEIEDAFENSLVPSPNPGFNLEFTKDGFCDLNFESDTGEQTQIASVGGTLSYLIYDSYVNNTSSGLLGTTEFESNYPLQIIQGENDCLSFRIEHKDGTMTDQIEITIPPKKYTRAEMIDLLNQKLAEHPDAAGITAIPYGDKSIQITGGSTMSITSLKGNMFNIETGKVTYTSVFYDNICQGLSTAQSPQVKGKAYFNPNYTTDLIIDSSNNTLAFRMENGSPIITIQLAEGTYYVDNAPDPNNPNKKTLNELVDMLNTSLDQATNGDVSASLGSASIYVDSIGYVSHSYIMLNSKTTGNKYSFEFDCTDNIHSKTYETLFTTTNFQYVLPPSRYRGSNDSNAQCTGVAYLKAPLTLNSNQLSINVNGASYAVTIPKTNYASLPDLAKDIEDGLTGNSQFPPELKDKINVSILGSSISIQGTDSSISNISVNATGAYEQLFTRIGEAALYDYQSVTGEEYYQQGSTAPLEGHNAMISVTMKYAIPDGTTVIDGNNDDFRFGLNTSSNYISHSVKLTHGTYTRQQLIDELNKQLGSYPIEASLSSDNKLVLTTTPTGRDTDLRIYVNSNYGTAWKAFIGSETRTIGPSSWAYSAGTLTSYRGINKFDTITLTNQNNRFEIQNIQPPKTITLDADTPYTPEALCQAINSQLSAVTVRASVNANTKCIWLEATSGDSNTFTIAPTGPDSFYATVLGKPYTNTRITNPANRPGSHSYTPAFIVGREDLRNNEVQIIKGQNDIFTLDLTYPGSADPMELTCTIPPGTYTYDAANQAHPIAEAIQSAFQSQLDQNPATSGLLIEAKIGGQNTGVTGSNDLNALSITLKEKPGTELSAGGYTLDGIRGSAAYYTFYKTSGSLEPSYTIGAQDISGGADIGPDNNELTISVDGTSHTYRFPEKHYTSQEIINFLNNEFTNGTDPLPLVASLEDGKLKLSCQVLGSYEILVSGGNAKGTLFYKELSRESQKSFMLQVGALGHQGLELPRLRVGTVALGINSITVTRPKYAEKALNRLNRAIDFISSKRSAYGALHNRIEHITASNGNASENTQASESRIRDADMAFEMTEHLRHRLLMQASEAILAQANQIPNRILNLLH